jgi:hypothetical protein
MKEKILNGKGVTTLKNQLYLVGTIVSILVLIIISAIVESNSRIVGVLLLPLFLLVPILFIQGNKYLQIKNSIDKYKISEATFLRFERMGRFFNIYVSYKDELNDEKEGVIRAYDFFTLEALQNQKFEIAYKDGVSEILIINYIEPSYDNEDIVKDEVIKSDEEKSYDDFFDKERYKL